MAPRRVFLLLIVVLLMAVLSTACSSDNASNGTISSSSMKSGKIDNAEIAAYVLRTCRNAGESCDDASFTPIRVVALTQNEKDSGVYQRVCGILAVAVKETDGEVTSNKGLAMFEQDRLGWHGFYLKGSGDVRDEYNKQVSSIGRDFWSENGCGTREEYKTVQDKIKYGGMALDGSADDWKDGKCEKDAKDSDIPESLDVRKVCTKMGDDYLFVLLEVNGAIGYDPSQLEGTAYSIWLLDSTDEADVSAGAYFGYDPTTQQYAGFVGTGSNQQMLSGVEASPHDGQYIEFAIPLSVLKQTFPEHLFMTVYSSNENVNGDEPVDSIEQPVQVW